MPSLATFSLLLASVAAFPFEANVFEAAKRQVAPACNRDNCYRAVLGTAFPARSSDCASFLRKTVTPCPVFPNCHYQHIYLGLDLLDHDVDDHRYFDHNNVDTDEYRNIVRTVIQMTTPTVTPTTTLPPAKKKRSDSAACPVTGSPSAVLAYAFACLGVVRYSSACVCGSFTALTTTLAPITTTTTITNVVNTFASAATITTSVDVVVIVVTSTISTATTTVTTTTTTTSTTSTAPAATAPAQQIENIDNCLNVQASFGTVCYNTVYKYGVRMRISFMNQYTVESTSFSGDLTACQAVQAYANFTDDEDNTEFNVYRRASDNGWSYVSVFFDGQDGYYSLVDSDVKSSYGFWS